MVATGIYSHHAEKANLGDTRDKDMKTRKIHIDENKHSPGKEWKLPYSRLFT